MLVVISFLNEVALVVFNGRSLVVETRVRPILKQMSVTIK